MLSYTVPIVLPYTVPIVLPYTVPIVLPCTVPIVLPYTVPIVLPYAVSKPRGRPVYNPKTLGPLMLFASQRLKTMRGPNVLSFHAPKHGDLSWFSHPRGSKP